ncbi:hypothetical protein [Oceanobacillus oncorhynchi]|uniref:hypothetical protein n=1 Tax=Oceanobacillus oncorhynchi TaxID=545501 RepID=UPI0018662408|nr:hypothetical protein [Oceanobacillus oncorhynchi]
MRRVKTPQEKSEFLFFYPQSISATLALSAPVGLPIAKSSLEEMSSGPWKVEFISGA